MRKVLRRAFAVAAGTFLAFAPYSAFAQAVPGDKPAWLDPALVDAAKKEGAVVVYSTTNEEEGLPLWQIFEAATGIKVTYVRASDSQILARILIENRASQHSWDLAQTANVNKVPPEFLAQFDPLEGKNIDSAARDPNRRWYGVYANYNAPAYNSKFVKTADLPQTYEDFLKHPEWAGKIAIDGTDDVWLATLFMHYGEPKARKLVQDIVALLHPVPIDGHLAVARAVGSGEYWLALNNYVNLTLNAKLSGAPTDFWALDPVPLFYGQVGVAALAPHPNAARLAANFAVSKEAETFLTKFGRLPTRADVESNPPHVLDAFSRHEVLTVLLTTEEDRKWIKEYNTLMNAR